jgi:hypothetical protein
MTTLLAIVVLMRNASLQLLPEAGAERSKAEALGSQLQGIVETVEKGLFARVPPLTSIHFSPHQVSLQTPHG